MLTFAGDSLQTCKPGKIVLFCCLFRSFHLLPNGDVALSTPATIFDQLSETFHQSGVEATLEKLATQLAEERKFHELFEARKLLLRHQLGLPLLYTGSGDELEEAKQNQLENGLADICREIGKQLMEEGKLREGWMYLRPVGDLDAARDYVEQARVDDENIDEVVELALREGIAPAYGFGLVLEHYGTCNSITTFDAEMSQHPLEERQQAAGRLVEHLHQELLENVRGDIQSEEGSIPEQDRFAEILPDREWLFDGNRYHIDTTHLASVTRFARTLVDEDRIRLAIDLTEYGKRLSSQYQYENEEPFADLYPSTQLYLKALLNEDVDQAVSFFEQKARDCDSYNDGYMAIEVYIELLSRIGQNEKAMEALIELMPDATPKIGIAPTILELSGNLGNFERFTEFCRQKEDVLGYVTGLLHKS